MLICTRNPGHIFINESEDMDAIRYFTGGIHFACMSKRHDINTLLTDLFSKGGTYHSEQWDACNVFVWF